MEEHKGLPLLTVTTQAKFAAWLKKNHTRDEGVWVKFAKKGSGATTVTYVQAREEAIRFGWIDGLKNAFDEKFFVLRFTPRRARSKWSQINRDIAQGLIDAGRMHAAGLAQVEAAQADGRWQRAYAPASKQEPHAELVAALKKSKKAKAVFDDLDSANRYAILFAVNDAVQDSTRARRIAKYVTMLERGEVPHPQRVKKKTAKKKTAKKKTQARGRR